MYRYNLSVLLFSLMFSLQCMGQSAVEKAQAIIHKWVPDNRLAVANFDMYYKKRTLYIMGETTEKNIVADLHDWATRNKIKTNIQVDILPDTTLIHTQGLIAVSVANLRKQPRHSAELVSQAILGTPVRILKDSAGHYLLQTPDKYIGWVTKASVKSLNDKQIQDWKKSNRYIYTNISGWLYADTTSEASLTDVCMGSLLVVIEKTQQWLHALLPNGQMAYVQATHATPFDAWAENTKPNATLLQQLAAQLMGVSYLWGGTSTKMLDCSGFTKTIYFMNGMLLARDASQQILQGQTIAYDNTFDTIEKGDLLFFGTEKKGSKRVTHVGMALGNGDFIHESEWVRINSLLPQSDRYSAYYAHRLLGVQRYITAPHPPDLLLKNNEFYF